MTSRAPVAAPAAIEMLTVRWVASVRVTELTVIPLPEKATAEVGHEPGWKFAPVTMMTWLAAPWPRELGPSEVMAGPALTVNPATASPGRHRCCAR